MPEQPAASTGETGGSAAASADSQWATATPDAQLRVVHDTSTVWLWEQDAEFRFITDLRGRDRELAGSVLGMRRWETPDSTPLRGTWDDHRKWVEARRPFWDFEFRIGHGPDARYISTTGVPVYYPDGAFAGYRGTAMDVTQLKNAQSETEKAQSLLRLSSRLGRVAAWSVELPAMRMIWSREFLHLFGFGEFELPTVRDVLALVHRGQQREVYRAWTACLETGLPFDLEVRVLARDAARWVRFIGEAVRDPHGTILRIQGAAQDVTASREDRERLRSLSDELAASNAELADRVRERTRELELANAELKGFAQALAHDLKAPITAVQGFSTALENSLAQQDLARAAHYGVRIKAAGVRMEEYVDALLSIAETSQAPISMATVDLSAIAASVLDDLQSRDPSRPLQRTIQPGLVVQGDRRLLQMLLENLLGNAWKFTARQARAEISLTSSTSDTGQAVYSVKDNGAGFDMAWAGKLFGNFQRLHSPQEYEGTGIGLANAQRVVTRHGGRIWAWSRVGEGATFSFTLHEPPADR